MTNKINLYIDESGKSSLREQEALPFIMTGVIISDVEVASIEGYFNYIKRKFSIPIDQPFHSFHVFEHPNQKLSDVKLLELSKVLADFISLIPAKVKILHIDKQQFKEALGVNSNDDFKGSRERKQMPDFPYRVMSTVLFEWFAQHLADYDAIGQIICDSRRGGDHHLLNTLNLCKEGHIPYFDKNGSQKINSLITAICFSEKNFLSGGLEITDLISYVSYFRARRLVSANTHLGIDILWKQISEMTKIETISKDTVRTFFGIKKGEVHKYLKS